MEHGKLAEKKKKKRMKCCFDMSPAFQLPGKRLLFSLKNKIQMKLQLNKIKIVIKNMLVLADPPWRWEYFAAWEDGPAHCPHSEGY